MVRVNVLRGRRPITHYLHVGITSYGLPCFIVSFEGSSDVSSTVACAGKWVLFACAVLFYLDSLTLHRPVTYRSERAGQGSKDPAYLGVDRRMTSLLSSKDGLRCVG